MKMRLLVCDDDEARAERWRERLEKVLTQEACSVIVPGKGELSDNIRALEERRKAARSGNRGATETLFDSADILVIDYDLLDLSETASSTGEEVAYLARCYSRCSIIVGLNQFGNDPIFDLRLTEHPESYADININSDFLDYEGLWKEPWSGFRPWVWPLLPEAVETFRRRVHDLENGAITTGILEHLELVDVLGMMSRTAVEFLDVPKGQVESTTFDDFVRNSPSSLRPKDEPWGDDSIARIAAARIHTWLERMILPGQDLIVDAPHLASRFPSLLGPPPQPTERWNSTASLRSGSDGFQSAVTQRHQYQKSEWLSREGWLWTSIGADSDIAEVADPWSRTRQDLVFCEDISRFLPKAATKEFVADLESAFVRRYVVDQDADNANLNVPDLKSIHYRPSARFAR